MCRELKLKPAILELLRKFPELTSEEKCLSPVKHNVVHRIITNGPPIAERPRRLNPRVRRQAEDILQKLLEDGTIEPSSSPWASPIHLVPKKSASWRLVGDYRLLNRVSKKDSYPLPYLQYFSNELNGKAVFSTVDLKYPSIRKTWKKLLYPHHTDHSSTLACHSVYVAQLKRFRDF